MSGTFGRYGRQVALAGAALVLFLGGLFAAGGTVGAQESLGELDAPEAAVERAYEDPELVSGTFTLTLSGPVAEGYSFYVETDFGSGHALICTTDPELTALDYASCAEGTHSVPFVVASGHELSYRILGNPGNELSQFVVAEGQALATEGLTLSADYAFTGDGNPLRPNTGYAGNDGTGNVGTGSAGAAGPEATTPDETAGSEDAGSGDAVSGAAEGAAGAADEEDVAADVQYNDDSDAEETTSAPQTPGGAPEDGGGPEGAAEAPVQAPVFERLASLLPQSGGLSLTLIAGAALLILGGLAVRRFLR